MIRPTEGTHASAPPGRGDVDARDETLTGLVLCGGRSSRLGRDKAVEIVGDSTLVARAAAVLGRLTSDVRLACGPTPRYAELGFPLVLDERSTNEAATSEHDGAHRGPLAGIAAGLAARASATRAAQPPGTAAAPRAARARLVVLACDLPFVDETLVRELVSFACADDLDLGLLRTERGLEPLVSVWTIDLLCEVRGALARGDFGVQAFYERLSAADSTASTRRPRTSQPRTARRCGTWTAPTPSLTNVNTPEDLEFARARVAHGPAREIA